ncbi:Rossmann-like domain-containing protein [Methanoregula sp.]|uniref:Rossmann-like domain-containing protein n=1 Tax=Methanoregula sp. TaxID=2052170 RepID=UPI003567E15C
MAKLTRHGDAILNATLDRLHELYRENHVRQGKLTSIAIKPRWIAITSSHNECGIATNCVGINTMYGTEGQKAITNLHSCIGKPLFDLAKTGIESQDLHKRALGIAALSALSQKFLGCNGIRKRGYLSECWKASDEFVQDYPAISHIVNLDDIVAIAGYGSQISSLHAWCRELHVINLRFPETFETVTIDKENSTMPGNIVCHTQPESEKILGNADVVLLSTSTLVDNSFSRLLHAAKNARLVGIYGVGASLIPDAFFDEGVDLFSSFRIVDPVAFCVGMKNDNDMDYSMMNAQKQYLMMRPQADIRDSPIAAFLRHSGTGEEKPDMAPEKCP